LTAQELLHYSLEALLDRADSVVLAEAHTCSVKLLQAIMAQLMTIGVRQITPCPACSSPMQIPPRFRLQAQPRLLCTKKECPQKMYGMNVLRQVTNIKKEILEHAARTAIPARKEQAKETPKPKDLDRTLPTGIAPHTEQEQTATQQRTAATHRPEEPQPPYATGQNKLREQIATLTRERDSLYLKITQMKYTETELEETIDQQITAIEAAATRIEELEKQVAQLRNSVQRAARAAARHFNHSNPTALHHLHYTEEEWDTYEKEHQTPQTYATKLQQRPQERPEQVRQAIDEGLRTITAAIKDSRGERKQRLKNTNRPANATRLPDSARPKLLTAYYFTSTAAIPFRKIKNSVNPILRQLPTPIPHTAIATMDWFEGQNTWVLEVIMDKEHEGPIAQALKDLQYRHWAGARPFETFTPRALQAPTRQTVQTALERLQKHATNEKSHSSIREHYTWLLARTKETENLMVNPQNPSNEPKEN